jgi:hypothetical protein
MGTTSLNQVLYSVLSSTISDQGKMENVCDACVPELSQLFDKIPSEFDFESFFLTDREFETEWVWRHYVMTAVFDAPFAYALPKTWDRYAEKDRRAAIFENQTQRLSIYFFDAKQWLESTKDFFEEIPVMGFYASPIYKGYSQVLFVTKHDNDWWVWSLYFSGSYCLLTKAGSSNVDELPIFIKSGMSSSPFYGWIQAAKTNDGILAT